MTIWHIQNNICIITVCYCPNLSPIPLMNTYTRALTYRNAYIRIFIFSHPASLSFSSPTHAHTLSIFLLYLIVLHHQRPHQRSTNFVFSLTSLPGRTPLRKRKQKQKHILKMRILSSFFSFYHLSQNPSSNHVIS